MLFCVLDAATAGCTLRRARHGWAAAAARRSSRPLRRSLRQCTSYRCQLGSSQVLTKDSKHAYIEAPRSELLCVKRLHQSVQICGCQFSLYCMYMNRMYTIVQLRIQYTHRSWCRPGPQHMIMLPGPAYVFYIFLHHKHTTAWRCSKTEALCPDLWCFHLGVFTPLWLYAATRELFPTQWLRATSMVRHSKSRFSTCTYEYLPFTTCTGTCTCGCITCVSVCSDKSCLSRFLNTTSMSTRLVIIYMTRLLLTYMSTRLVLTYMSTRLMIICISTRLVLTYMYTYMSTRLVITYMYMSTRLVITYMYISTRLVLTYMYMSTRLVITYMYSTYRRDSWSLTCRHGSCSPTCRRDSCSPTMYMYISTRLVITYMSTRLVLTYMSTRLVLTYMSTRLVLTYNVLVHVQVHVHDDEACAHP